MPWTKVLKNQVSTLACGKRSYFLDRIAFILKYNKLSSYINITFTNMFQILFQTVTKRQQMC
jgi:hypothetical protein